MCEPVSIAMAALTIAGGVASAQAQGRAANRQAAALGLQADADQAALALQMNETATAAADEMNQRSQQARIEAATFDAITSEYGGGVSAERGAAELAFARNADLARIQTNRDANLAQLGRESLGANARLNSGLASLQRPSKLGTALTIAGNLASGAGSSYIRDYQADQRTARQEERRKVRYGEWVENNRLEGAKDLRPNRAGA